MTRVFVLIPMLLTFFAVSTVPASAAVTENDMPEAFKVIEAMPYDTGSEISAGTDSSIVLPSPQVELPADPTTSRASTGLLEMLGGCRLNTSGRVSWSAGNFATATGGFLDVSRGSCTTKQVKGVKAEIIIKHAPVGFGEIYQVDDKGSGTDTASASDSQTVQWWTSSNRYAWYGKNSSAVYCLNVGYVNAMNRTIWHYWTAKATIGVADSWKTSGNEWQPGRCG